MSESKSLVKLQGFLLISEPDSEMEVAAQQLMQLSDEDNNSSSVNSNNESINNNKKETKAKMIGTKRLYEQSQDEITSAKIEEIFGKEEQITRKVIKKRKYRSVESIYKETKPIKVRYAKNLWY